MRVARPWHWFLLYVPFGVTGGFVHITLGHIGKRLGMTEIVIASIVGMTLLPQTWKFLWGPLADTTLDRKKWYVLSNVVLAATILPMAFIPFNAENVGTFKVLIFVNAIASSFLGMAVEGLMAHATTEAQRGTAAGWFQAGNLGGFGIGGGVALMVAEHVSIAACFVTVTAIVAACNSVLVLVPNAPREHFEGSAGAKIVAATRAVVLDLWKMIASRRGVVALFMMLIPLGAGAATGLFSAVADRWGASAETVAIVTGVLGGLVSAVGCLAGGWLSDRMSRRNAYILSGVILAAVAALMAITPKNEVTYTVFVLAYNFAVGMVFGCFTGFLLEIIGHGAIATKYNALAALSNIPILYMTYINGWAAATHGPSTMLLGEAAAGVAGALALLLVISIVRPGRTPAVS